MAVVARRLSARFEVVTGSDVSAVYVAAAERIQAFSRQTGAAPFTIALSGGETPKRLYEILAGEPFRTNVAWDRLEFFFSDERPVAVTHPDSNFGMAMRTLLSQVPATAHPMPAESGTAEVYEQLLARRVSARQDSVPALDLVLLGIGEDGHTASLFPGTAALAETKRWVVMNEVPALDTRRMTFTYPLIEAARRVWIMAVGARKREIVARCLAARGRPGLEKKWPVLGVNPKEGEIVWWLDEAAAGTAAAITGAAPGATSTTQRTVDPAPTGGTRNAAKGNHGELRHRR